MRVQDPAHRELSTSGKVDQLSIAVQEDLPGFRAELRPEQEPLDAESWDNACPTSTGATLPVEARDTGPPRSADTGALTGVFVAVLYLPAASVPDYNRPSTRCIHGNAASV